MRLWRVSNHADLSGEGGRRHPARWNSAGRPVVYLAEHPALALLEDLVHLELDPDDLPDSYQLLEIAGPDESAFTEQTPERLTASNPGWRDDIRFTQSVGDAWLAAGSSLFLRIPSVIVPKSTNALLNPAHPDAALANIVSITRPACDRRLFRTY